MSNAIVREFPTVVEDREPEKEIAGAITRLQTAINSLQSILRHPNVVPTLSDDLNQRRRSTVRTIIHVRDVRDQYLGNTLFVDPAWNILLDAYASELDGRRLSVGDACIAAGVPSSTALRWLRALEKKGLIERRPDAVDRRRAFVGLTRQARATLEALIDQTIRLMSGSPQLT